MAKFHFTQPGNIRPRTRIKNHYNFSDISGVRFGRLVAIEHVGRNAQRELVWKCNCDCGTIAYLPGTRLRRGITKSCGCLQRELAAQKWTTHGLKNLPEYLIWKGLKDRCKRKTSKAYASYGGRGIMVCDRWRASFAAFFQDMGPRPSPRHQIDRYPDNDGNYEPGNCRWATAKENCRHTRRSHLLTVGGKTQTVTEWAEEVGAAPGLIKDRLRLGWSAEDAVTRPVRKIAKGRHGANGLGTKVDRTPR